MKITNNRAPMSLENIREVCPSAFTVECAPTLSGNYTHIPTSRVIEDMIELGWTPVSAQEIKARKRKGFQKHLIRFQNQNLIIEGTDGDDVFPELLLTNSHDGKNAFHLRVGLYRFVCANGLVVTDEEFNNVSIRHIGYTFEELRTQVLALIETLPNLVRKINTFQKIELSEEQISEFAEKAVEIRWKDKKVSCSLNDLILPQRHQDRGNNLWMVYNRLQENLMGGGFSYRTGKGKVRKVRALKNFTQDIQFNSELWELAESYAV